MKKLSILFISAISLMGASSLQAANNFFNLNGGDYATPGNWSLGTIPGNGNNDQPWIGNGNVRDATYSTAVGYITNSRFVIGISSGGIGTLTMSGAAGSLTFGGDSFGTANYVGVDSGTGFLNLLAGTMNITEAGGSGVGGHLFVGANAGGPGPSLGTVYVNGGTLNLGTRLLLGVNRAGNWGTLTIDSGVVNIGTGSNADGDKGHLYMGNTSGNAVLNLNGGTLSLVQFNTGGAVASRTINFNGGVVAARANNANFLTAGTLNIKNNGAIFDTAGFGVTVSPALLNSGSGGLTKIGNGTLTLSSNASSFVGDVNINGGVVTIAGGLGANPANTALGASGTARNIFVNNNATLTFSNHDPFGNASTTNQRKLTIAGGTVKSTGWLVTLGNIELNGSTMTADGGPNFGGSNIGTFQLNGTVTVTGSAPSVMNDTGAADSRYLLNFAGGATTFNVADVTSDANPDLTISTLIANGWAGTAAGITKTGAGTLVLSGINTYTGATTVSGGTLSIATGGALSNAGNVNTTGGGVLTIAGTLTMAANTYFATGNGIASTTGTTIIESGAVVNLGGNSVLIGGNRPGGVGGTGSGTGTLTINGGLVTVDAASGTGGGTDNNNIWLDPYGNVGPSTLNLNGGILSTARHIADGSGGNSVFNFNGGTLQTQIAGDFFLNTMTVNVNAGGAIIDTGTFNVTISKTLQHGTGTPDGGLTKTGTGTLTLTGGGSWTGATLVNNGVLQLAKQAGGPTSSWATPTITVGNGSTLQFGTHDNFGNAAATAGPAVTINAGGTVINDGGAGNWFNPMWNLTLSGGTLYAKGGHGTWGAYALGGTVTVNTAVSTITGDGTANAWIDINNAGTAFNVADVTGDATVDLTISAPITSGGSPWNNGRLIKTGPGTMALTVANSYSGGTTLGNGTLQLGNLSALGTGGATINGGTLDLNAFGISLPSLAGSGGVVTDNSAGAGTTTLTVNQATTTSFSGVIQDGGAKTLALTKSGSGAVALSGANTYAGNTTVTGGTLQVSGGGSVIGTLSLITQTGGTVVIDNSTVTLASNSSGVFGVGYGVAGTGSVTVNAGGVLNVGNGGDRTFIGGGPSGGPYGNGVLTINTGGTVNVGAAGTNPNNNIWFNGFGTTATSTLNLNGGILSTARTMARGSGTQGQAVVNANGGTLQAAAGIDLIVNTVTANINAGGLTVDSQNFGATISAPLLHGTGSPDGGLTKTGTGTLTLTSTTSSFNGDLNIVQGTVVAGAGHNNTDPRSALGAVNAVRNVTVGPGTTLTFAANDVLGNASAVPTAALVINGGVVDNNGSKFNVLGPVTLNGGTLTGAGGAAANYQTYFLRGTVTVTGSSPSTMSSTGSNNGYHLSAPTTFDVANVTGDASADLTVTAPLINQTGNQGGAAGGLTKIGNGTMALTAANTYSGATTISGGTLMLGGALSAPVAGMAIWLDGADAATVFADTGKTTLASPGGTVAVWADKSANTWDVSQSNGAQQPTYQTAVQYGNAVVRFDGNNDVLNRSAGALSTASALSVFYVMSPRYNSLVYNPGVVGIRDSIFNPTRLSIHEDMNRTRIYAYNGTGSVIGIRAVAQNAFTEAAVIASGSGRAVYSLGNLLNSGAGGLGSSAVSWFNIGSSSPNGEWLNGDIAEVLVYMSALSDTDRLAVEQYLTAKWLGTVGYSILPTATAVNINASGATLDLNNLNQTIGSLAGVSGSAVVMGKGSLIVGDATSTVFAGTISGTGSLTKQGAGQLALTGPNTYTGGTTINAGTLAFASGGLGSSGNIMFGGTSALKWVSGNTQDVSPRIQSLSGGSTVTLDITDGSVTFASAISGNGAVTKTGAGALVLTTDNTYTGATTINAGELALTGSAQLSATTGLTVNGGTFRQNSSVAWIKPLTFNAGTISGTGDIGSSSISVPVTVGSGRVLSPGNSPGAQTFYGNMTWSTGGTYHWEIADWTGALGTDWDYIHLYGGLNLANPSSTDQFTIEITGLGLGDLPANFVRGSEVAFPILHSYGSGIDDFSSNTNWFVLDTSGFGFSMPYTSWTIYQEGNTLWLKYSAMIPEPTTVMLLGLGGLLLFLGRRGARRPGARR